MNTHSARHLRQTGDRFFDLTRRRHHQVGQFVDHNNDIGQPFTITSGITGFVAEAWNRQLLLVLVINFEISDAAVRQFLISCFHLGHSPLQRILRDLRFRDDRHQQMRNVLIQSKLEPFRIDQDHLHLVGPRAEKQRENHGVDRDALSRTG